MKSILGCYRTMYGVPQILFVMLDNVIATLIPFLTMCCRCDLSRSSWYPYYFELEMRRDFMDTIENISDD